MFMCNVCERAVAVRVQTDGMSPNALSGNIRTARGIRGIDIRPQRAPIGAPKHCPENIANAFVQAEENIVRENPEAAASMDRRAIEIATKLMAPEHTRPNLYDRIEKLAQSHLITPALKDWAHQMRAFGNDALHDIEGLTIDEARQGHELTRFILIYLFTLPEQIRLAKEIRENKG